MESDLLIAVSAFFLSFFLIRCLKPAACRVGLLDQPDERKQHAGIVPLVGGLAIYLTIMILGFLFLSNTLLLDSYLIAAGMMTIIGALDDRYDLRVSIRVLSTFAATAVTMIWAGMMFSDLGNVFGLGDVSLPVWLAAPFTLVAAFGVVNAYNMIDGLDGLSAGVTMLSLSSILVAGNPTGYMAPLIIIMILAITAFQLYNLQISRRLKKVFLGDAGSMLIGFSIIFLIEYYSQPRGARGVMFEPVTGLFFIGLPLVDMVTTVLRRLFKKQSPFKADRTHAHHILLRAGFTPKMAMLILVLISAIFNLTGLYLDYVGMESNWQILIFLLYSFAYYKMIKRAYKFSRFLRSKLTYA
ncbi:undecaprenyl/decaprenyl-phosphate alpha-N-acetylglucosaminyl 1-phosphate transferase [Endozoicomonas arenosclerae]|uniref:undecaprenyl/decaprenyl-phosphate alpha-N-acetylglucosaminyl 1-phosphate transferase n=1 Tax=Endozoicomonas arenosclerae TaxID=1633495 RepID=UPI00078264AB|nr:undecaprenyl/decaprenyl-phosphate alpha-N-acetylglucosaminyl 1-phosphate transferase [Endozoicomonas arenosclerae]